MAKRILMLCLAFVIGIAFAIPAAAAVKSIKVSGDRIPRGIYTPRGIYHTISAKELWNCQYLYFQNISSLEFHSTMGLIFSEEMKQKQKSPIEKLETPMDFSLDGNKYRSEVSFLDIAAGKKDKTISAYNGQLYQLFQANARSLTVSKSTENMLILRYNPYMGMNQILVPFLFAFHSTRDIRFADQNSIDTLKKPEVWSRLVKDTGEILQTNMNNHNGVNVTLKKEQEDITRKGIYEIFFATDLDYFPIYYKLTSLGGVLLSEVKILETQKCGSKNIIIPLRIETKEYFDDGNPAQSMILEIDPKTLKVNEKINPEIFTIPVNQDDIKSGAIKYFDADAPKNVPSD